MASDLDAFTLSKQEILAKTDLVLKRIMGNPLVSKKVKGFFQGNVFLLKRANEKDLQYAIVLLNQLTGQLIDLNYRRTLPELKNINPMFEKQVDDKLTTTPEEQQKESRAKIVVDFTKGMFQKGAMKDA